MDNQISNESEDRNQRWIDDRLASLTPPANWHPHADRAFDRMMQRQKRSQPKWIRFSMAGAALAAAVVIVGLLPWNALWKAEPEKPANQTAPISNQEVAASAVAQVGEMPAPAPTTNGTMLDTPDKPERLFLTKTIPPLPDLPGDHSALVEAKKKGHIPEFGQAPQPSEAGVTDPVLVSQVQPVYTEEAKKARITGVIELVCTVNKDGSVTVDRISKSLGYGLDESAQDAVSRWKFLPAKKDGTPVSKTITINVSFGLK
jgi:TonB family protein